MEEIFCNGKFSVMRIFEDGNYDICLNDVPVYLMPTEKALELADAIYKAEGIDLAAVTAERDRMREAIDSAIIAAKAEAVSISGKGIVIDNVLWALRDFIDKESPDDEPKFSSLLGSVPELTGDKSTEEFLDDIREPTDD